MKHTDPFFFKLFQVNRTGYMTITELGVNVTTNSAYFSWEVVGAEGKINLGALKSSSEFDSQFPQIFCSF